MSPTELDTWIRKEVSDDGKTLRRNDYRIIMSDYSAFDTTISREALSLWHDYLHYVGCPIMSNQIRLEPNERGILQKEIGTLGWCFRTWSTSVGTTRARNKFRLPWMNCSGRGDTAALNFFLNFVTQYSAYLITLTGSLGPYTPQQYEYINSNVKFIALGDDSLVFAPKLRMDGSKWDFSDLQAAIALFGFEFSEGSITEDPRDIIFLGQRIWPVKQYEPNGEILETVSWAPVLGRYLYKINWRKDTCGDPFAWLKGISDAITSTMAHLQILNDIARRQKQLLHHHTQTPYYLTTEYQKEHRYKHMYQTRSAVIGPDDARAISFLQYHYGIDEAEYRYIQKQINSITSLPTMLNNYFLDAAMAKEAS